MVSNSTKQNGVYYITEKKDAFSSVYIEVRKKEGRIYNDHTVQQLPKVLSNHKYYNEWKLRQKSTKRIVDYLTNKNTPLKILDLGCGNGWFSSQLSFIPNAEIYAIDVNHVELEQASRVFQKPNLKFIYADIFSSEIDVIGDFDIITVNSCIQYFENLEAVIKKLKEKLVPKGELHIIDSPFYKFSEISIAQKRTKDYYNKLGVPAMTSRYFHHSLEHIKDYEVRYQPKHSLLDKVWNKKDSPFMWLVFSMRMLKNNTS